MRCAGSGRGVRAVSSILLADQHESRDTERISTCELHSVSLKPRRVIPETHVVAAIHWAGPKLDRTLGMTGCPSRG